MRFLGCIGVLIALAMIMGGGQGLYESWSAGKLRSVTYDQLVAEHPGVGWFKVTDGQWQLADATVVTKQSRGATGDLYIPVRKAGSDNPAAKIDVVLHRDNLGDSGRMERLIAMSPAEARAEVASHPAFLDPRPVQGTVEFGMETDDKNNALLRKQFGDQLADNYTILTDGAQPMGYGSSAAYFGGGLLILLGMIALGRRSASKPAAA